MPPTLPDLEAEQADERRELEALLIANGIRLAPSTTVRRMRAVAEVHGALARRPEPVGWPSLVAV